MRQTHTFPTSEDALNHARPFNDGDIVLVPPEQIAAWFEYGIGIVAATTSRGPFRDIAELTAAIAEAMPGQQGQAHILDRASSALAAFADHKRAAEDEAWNQNHLRNTIGHGAGAA